MSDQTMTFNIQSFKRPDSTWSDAWDEAIAAVVSMSSIYHAGATIEVPPLDMVIQRPIVLPRSGTPPVGVVHIKGAGRTFSTIRGDDTSPEFDAGRALIEWDDTSAIPTYNQRITGLLLHPAHKHGCRAIHYKLHEPLDTSGVPKERLQIHLEDITIEGSNEFLEEAIYLEGSLYGSTILDIEGNVSRSQTTTSSYDTILLRVDETAAVLSNETRGLHFSRVSGLRGGVRKGGYLALFRGRLMLSELSDCVGDGGRNLPVYDIRNSYASALHRLASEGRGEKPQYRFQNCVALRGEHIAIGTPNDAGLGIGNGMELIGVTDSTFDTRPAVPATPTFSTRGVKLLRLDATCARNRFVNWMSNGVAADEVEVLTPPSAGNSVEILNPSTGVATHIGPTRVNAIRRRAEHLWSATAVADGYTSVTVPVPGVELGDHVLASVDASLGYGVLLYAQAESSGAVRVTLHNRTAAPISFPNLRIAVMVVPRS
jgi:hypothetical protein